MHFLMVKNAYPEQKGAGNNHKKWKLTHNRGFQPSSLKRGKQHPPKLEFCESMSLAKVGSQII